MTADERPFSRRFGYRGPESEITVREDASQDLRAAIVMLADNLGLSPKNMRLGACSALLKSPDPNNWSDYPNVFGEVQGLVESCPWHKVRGYASETGRHLKEGRDPRFEDAELVVTVAAAVSIYLTKKPASPGGD